GEEGRLEARAGRAQETQPPLLRAGMRPLVRQDDSILVRLRAQRRDDALAGPLDAVRAGVPLREPPVRRLVVLHENAFVAPPRERARRLLLGVWHRLVYDVVRA